jgi:hypothetical protein
MIRVHILSNGFKTPNSRGLEYPIRRNLRRLRARGITATIFHRLDPALGDCDTVIVDGRFFRDFWNTTPDRVYETIAGLRRGGTRVLYFDTSDSAGWLKIEIVPHVDRYYKNQILADTSRFLTPLYGGRLYADYYHRTANLQDSTPLLQPGIADAALLDKLRVSWNSGLADYSFAGLYLAELHRHLGWNLFLRAPGGFSAPDKPRSNDISCRMTTRYARETVSWQRLRIQELLSKHLPTDRLSRRQYFRELANSQIVVSPFGFGEINYKDFETFISGAVLLKPDMSHMRTWPDFYHANETIVSHSWDLKDFEHVIETLLGDRDRMAEIAGNGQRTYHRYTTTAEGQEMFCSRFAAIAADTVPPNG